MEVEGEEVVTSTKDQGLILFLDMILLKRKLNEILFSIYEMHHRTVKLLEIVIEQVRIIG